jgi:hypothetical protein
MVQVSLDLFSVQSRVLLENVAISMLTFTDLKVAKIRKDQVNAPLETPITPLPFTDFEFVTAIRYLH